MPSFATCSCLVLRCTHDGNAIAFAAGAASVESTTFATVYFVKRRSMPLVLPSLRRDVTITIGTGDILQTLYTSVHNLYVPTLSAASTSAAGLIASSSSGNPRERLNPRDTAKLRSALVELDRGLASRLRSLHVSDAVTSGDADDGALSIDATAAKDELLYCSELRKRGGRSAIRADALEKAIAPVVAKIETLPLVSIDDLADCVEAVGGGLDGLWRLRMPGGADGYPASRMRRLVEMASDALVSCLSRNASSMDLLNGPATEVRTSLTECSRVLEDWCNSVRTFTGSAWSTVEWHPWTDGTIEDEQAGRLIPRLHDVIRTRELYDAATWLAGQELPPAATTTSHAAKASAILTKEAVLSSFSSVACAFADAESFTSYTSDAWSAVMASHEQSLLILDGKLSDALKRVVLSKQATVASHFDRVSPLLQRPSVLKTTRPDRSRLLAQLLADVDTMEAALQERARASSVSMTAVADEAAAGTTGSDSAHIREVLWARGTESRLVGSAALAKKLYSDLPGTSDALEALHELSQKLSAFQTDVFQAWCAAYNSSLKSGRLALDLAGPMMQFDSAGNMIVRFPEALVILLHDCRRWAELGGAAVASANKGGKPAAALFALPDSLRTVASDGERFFRYGLQLHRVAAFYNTIGSEIVPSQKPFLLEPLLKFERLVSEGAGGFSSSGAGAAGSATTPVSWRDGRRVASLIDQLQRAAEEVAAANRRLRAAHMRAMEQAAAMMRFDMVRNSEGYRDALGAFANTVSSAATPHLPVQTSAWLTHCGHQLFKAVEACFRHGLETFHESLTEIRVELAYSQASREPEFRPSIDEMRASYYRELQRHLQAPSSALSSLIPEGHACDPKLTSLFAAMPDRNGASVSQAYRKAEILFARLGKLREQLRQWVAVGSICPPTASSAGSTTSSSLDDTLDAYVKQTVTSPADFDSNFTVVKAKRREADRLQDIHRIDCVTVDVTPLKRAIDSLLQRLYDTLLVSLRRRIAESLSTVEEYLDRGLERMGRPLNNLEEIGAAQADWRALTEARSRMKALSTTADDQQRLLAAAAAGALFNVNDVSTRLERLAPQWDAFDSVLESFTAAMDAQRTSLRDSVAGQIAAVATKADRLVQRWSALRSSYTGEGQQRGWAEADVSATFTALTDWRVQLDEVKASAQAVCDSCAGFGLDRPNFESVTSLDIDITAVTSLWERFNEYNAARAALAAQDWITFRGRLFDLQDFAVKWGDAVASAVSAPSTSVGTRPDSGKPDVISQRIASETELIRRGFNALKYARGECFKEEHWAAVIKHLRMPKGTALESLTVGHFLGCLEQVASSVQWLKDLHSRAQGEVAIREALQELRTWSESTVFKLSEHVSASSGTRTPLVKEWKDLVAQIGDNQSLLQSLKDSPYFKPFADGVAILESQLSLLDGLCISLASIQRRWVYLEPVFGRDTLPTEQPRFKRVEEQYRGLMARLEADPRLFSLADSSAFPNLKEQLSASAEQLERCQRALTDYLEDRRAAFPRFYFIGNDDLLEILGQAHRPDVIQLHLKKLFQGVHRVELSGSSGNSGVTSITAVVSALGEVVRLRKPVVVTTDVTSWLSTLSTEVSDTLASLLLQYLKEPAEITWMARLVAYPSQIHCLGEQVMFCRAAEGAISAGHGAAAALAALRSRLEQSIALYTAADVSGDPLMSSQVKALVMDAVHHCDVIDQLSSKDVRSASSWQWQKQLRFYVDARTGRAVARMVDASIDYSYEYQGNTPRLVHTALTDKCYLVLTQGLAHGYGGNPYGPAGTGKTESVKALGAAVGRQVLVFNCDEGIDFQSMGRIFAGIVRCGAWGCFGE